MEVQQWRQLHTLMVDYPMPHVGARVYSTHSSSGIRPITSNMAIDYLLRRDATALTRGGSNHKLLSSVSAPAIRPARTSRQPTHTHHEGPSEQGGVDAVTRRCATPCAALGAAAGPSACPVAARVAGRGPGAMAVPGAWWLGGGAK